MSVMSLHLCLVLFSASSGFFDRADFPDLKKHRLQLMFPFHPRLYQSARLQLPSPPLNSSIRSSLYKSADCNYRLSFSLSLSNILLEQNEQDVPRHVNELSERDDDGGSWDKTLQHTVQLSLAYANISLALSLKLEHRVRPSSAHCLTRRQGII